MSKFKAGDRVKVVKNVFGGIHWWIGSFGVIDEIKPKTSIKGHFVWIDLRQKKFKENKNIMRGFNAHQGWTKKGTKIKVYFMEEELELANRNKGKVQSKH